MMEQVHFGALLQLQSMERFLERLMQLIAGTHMVDKNTSQITSTTFID
jgi:hypothetical protein